MSALKRPYGVHRVQLTAALQAGMDEIPDGASPAQEIDVLAEAIEDLLGPLYTDRQLRDHIGQVLGDAETTANAKLDAAQGVIDRMADAYQQVVDVRNPTYPAWLPRMQPDDVVHWATPFGDFEVKRS